MIPSAIARIVWRLGDESPGQEVMDFHGRIPTGGKESRNDYWNRHFSLRCQKSAIVDRRRILNPLIRLAFEEVGIDLVVVFVKHSRFSGIGALNGKP